MIPQELRKKPLDRVRFRTYTEYYIRQPKPVRSIFRILKLISYEYRMQRHDILRKRYSNKAVALMRTFEKDINNDFHERLHSN